MGIKVTDTLIPTSEIDTYPITDPKYGLGGHRTVDLYSDLAVIPEARKQDGMTVYVKEHKARYILEEGSWRVDSVTIVYEPLVSQW